MPHYLGRNSCGFTLLEVLIATSLLGVIMLLLFSGFSIAGRSWDSGEQRAAEVNSRLVVANFLRQHITAALPLFDDFSDDEPVFSFIGGPNSVQFVSTLPAYRGKGGLHGFTLELEGRGDGKQLMLRLKPFYPVLEDEEKIVEDMVLLEGVKTLELAYYGAVVGEDEPQWTDQWEEQQSLPLLVRIDITPTAAAPWPVILAQPRIDRR